MIRYYPGPWKFMLWALIIDTSIYTCIKLDVKKKKNIKKIVPNL